MEPLLLRRRHGAIEIVTLNRPQRRNALSTDLLAALDAAFAELARDDAVRAIVLTGAGDRAFCSGLDLKDFARDGTGSPVGAADDGEKSEQSVIAWDYPKPIVAAVNGAAVAGGFELMMCCDLVVAAEHAVFALAEVKRALLPGGGGTLLATRIPLALALELTLTGDPFDARRALDVGLVNRVVPGPRVLEEALALAERVAANGPLAVAMIKRLVRKGAWPTREQIAQIFESEDAKEGALAFVEKRAPRWRGR